MTVPDIQKLYRESEAGHGKEMASLNAQLAMLNKKLEGIRSVSVTRKVPVVEEPPRQPEKCFWDFLVAEVLWLQNDMSSERKWKQTQAKKLGRELVKHKYIVDRQSGVDIVEQNLRKVSLTLATEVEKFWKGVSQLAHHRFGKQRAQLKLSHDQKRLDELVKRTEDFVDGSSVAKKPRLATQCLLDEIATEMSAAQPTGNSFSTSNVTIPIPSLLRANLREYQHIGLQWLATLHDRNLNGILADEMGLGKTLQTISLLAHLACEKGIWGPHLVVVPTSVMINWEIEFKKFLPGFKVMVYFGSPKERQMKRVGWRDDNVFNVCICSYALVLQDALVFRKKNWHYLILDEAHHIKNFKSLRWQNLLTFKTQRRLLLTGTPLQNDLVELWSLLHFLMPDIFTSHLEFQEWFSDPLTKAIEQSSGLAQHEKLVERLHSLIRPFLLRRLKRDVEQQMPSKYEHVVPVSMSRRQQVLYDELLSHREMRSADPKMGKGNDYLGLMNVLMQLRKVCNHPDLLEPRQVKSPFVMALSELSVTPTQFERWKGFVELEKLRKSLVGNISHSPAKQPDDKRPLLTQLLETFPLHQPNVADPELSPFLENEYIAKRFFGYKQRVRLHNEEKKVHEVQAAVPSVSVDTIRFLRREFLGAHKLPSRYASVVKSGWNTVSRFLMYSEPVQVSPWSPLPATPPSLSDVLYAADYYRGITEADPVADESLLSMLNYADMSRRCQLPDKRFLELDSGKFKYLHSLLSRLHAENHKVILFTQMSRMLDVIEAFINLCGFTYVRLDGSTKVADRQLLVDRFNRDKKLFLFVASTRAGGVGINLTGADTVVFFDSDWNPAMDKQAMDRCHRIGQTRDVHIYRLVSEKTIEENIFVKQLQKRKLDEIVLDRGKFNQPGEKPMDDLIGALLDQPKGGESGIYGTHVLWERDVGDVDGKPVVGENGGIESILAQVEDVEDVTMVPKGGVAVQAVAAEVEDGESAVVEEDKSFLALPGIVRLSVERVQAELVKEAESADANESDENEWKDLENAEWDSSDGEEVDGGEDDSAE